MTSTLRSHTLMIATLRYLRPLFIFATFCLAFSACDCSSDTGGEPIDEGCEHSDECPAGEECVDGVCVDLDEPVDTGSDADMDTDIDTAPDPDTGPDADTGPDPDCPDPNTCEDYGADCGWIPDGCGGTVNCGGCPGGFSCGAGDDQNQCVPDDCVSDVTCESANVDCGPIADGCGDMIDCGGCPEGYLCGVGANAGQCVSSDCQPLTCADHTPGECGPHPDGCGGFVDCGPCHDGHSCDNGECVAIQCQPLTCADHGNPQCGSLPDGCGGFVHCGDCSGGQVCGTGADLGTCVDHQCQPLSCADYPDINCGLVPDGCGDTIDCGDCTSPEICGGGGLPNVCGADPADGCEGLCQDQAICTANDPEDATTITGTVFAPNGDLPIPNAVVYVPNLDDMNDLPDIEPATQCLQCEDEELGNPLVGTTTNYDGTFELRHVPAGVEFPLVIKIGQWRRVVTIGPLTRCQSHSLTAQQTRLPTSQGEGSPHDNLPLTAITTGAVDAMECVFYKLGVDLSEFTRHYQDGRFHLYRANGGLVDQTLSSACSGRCALNSCTDRDPGSCQWDANGVMLQDNLSHNLYGSQSQLNQYDMVVMGCEANDHTWWRTDDDKGRILNYVNTGGRLFASHYAYDWLHQTDQLEQTANWGGQATYTGQSLAYVDTSHPGGGVFWDWLQLVDANHDNNQQINITDPRTYVTGVNNTHSTRWVHNVAGAPGHISPSSIQQYTFDTPVGAAADTQCGQVAYSAFHVAGVNTTGGPAFPGYCSGGDLTPQEKVLAYMLFDLAACVTEDGEPPDPVCEPQTCADLGAECGMASDGCGDAIFCGDCPDPLICGADPSQPNQCGEFCAELTCADHGAQCGVVSDGCGGTVDCGPCPDGQACGAGGVPNQCDCVPMECSDHGAECGEVSDGCGGTIDCGPCPDGQQCGASGIPNVCSGDCTPLSCDDHGAECGTVADGCGSTIDCGDCPEPLTCGGAGVPNECGCTPLSCDDHGAECGEVSDGCGDILDCGECPHGACVDFQCVCVGLGEPCQHNADCCSEMCGVGSDGEGTCITG